MPLNIPVEIKDLLMHEIHVETQELDGAVQKLQDDSEAGYIPTGADQFDKQVRAIRKKALRSFEGVKIWFGNRICWLMHSDARSPGGEAIAECEGKLLEAYANKERIVKKRQNADEETRYRTNHEKYLLYRDIFKGMEKEYSKLQLRGLLFGIFLTLIFAAVDFFMLRTMFITSNFTYADAQLYAVLCAIALDLPPYILGFVSAKQTDSADYFEIMGISTSGIAKRTAAVWKVTKLILAGVVTVFLTLYLFMCVTSFLGGGDFNVGLHALAERNSAVWKDIEWRNVDMLTSFIPLATSGCAGAVGILLQPSKADLFKKYLLNIDNELKKQMEQSEQELTVADKEINRLKKELSNIKAKYWGIAKYTGQVPINESELISKITEKFRNAFIPNYKQLYKDGCWLVREEALKYLASINSRLLSYAGDPGAIRDMSLSEEERDILDNIWKDGQPDDKQSAGTKEHLQQIQMNEQKFTHS